MSNIENLTLTNTIWTNYGTFIYDVIDVTSFIAQFEQFKHMTKLYQGLNSLNLNELFNSLLELHRLKKTDTYLPESIFLELEKVLSGNLSKEAYNDLISTFRMKAKSETSVWSKHTDFSPEKRIQYRFVGRPHSIIKEKGLLEETLFEKVKCLSQNSGSVFMHNYNFCFMDQRMLAIRFDKIMYKENIRDVLPKIKASVSKETMTTDDIFQTSVLMSYTKMLSLKCKYAKLEDYTIMFLNFSFEFLNFLISNNSYSDLASKDFIYASFDDFLDSNFFLIPASLEAFAGKMEEVELSRLLRTKVDRFAQLQLKDKMTDFIRFGSEGKPTTFKLRQSGFKIKADSNVLNVHQNVLVETVKYLWRNNSIERSFKFLVSRLERVDRELASAALERILKYFFINDNSIKLNLISSPVCQVLIEPENFQDAVDELKMPQQQGLLSLMIKSEDVLLTLCDFFCVEFVPHFLVKANIYRYNNIIVSKTSQPYETVGTDTGIVGYFKRKYNAIAGGTKKVYNTLTSLDETKKSVDEAMMAVKDCAKSYCAVLEKNGFTVGLKAVTADFSSFQSGLGSFKMIINTLFNDILSKVANIVTSFADIEVRTDLDPYLLFWQYLLWQRTECSILKFMIVMDICVMTGIADLLWSVLVSVAKKIGNFGKAIFTTAEDEDCFENYINAEDNLEIPITPKLVNGNEEEDGEKFLTKLFKGICEESPKILTAVVVGVLGFFGIKPLFNKEIDFRKYGTVLGAISLTIGVVPKIYSGLLKVFEFVVDYIKSVVKEDHKTELQLIKDIDKWLSSTLYLPGTTEALFMEDPPYAITFMEHYAEMQEMRPKIHKLKNPQLVSTFNARVRIMTELYPAAKAGLQTAVVDHEMFHVQFYSKPGAGKTDLNHNIATLLHRDFQELVNDTLKTNGLTEIDLMKREFAFYPANDTLSYEDNLFDQFLAITDEENVMNEVEADVIVTKLMSASGAPAITNQASLSSKGRIRPIKVRLSNTNNPFPRPKGMLTPQALWRRRILIEARVKNEFQEDGKIRSDVPAAIRANSEHLEFRWLDEVDDGIRPHSESRKAKFEWIGIVQLKKLIRFLLKKQYITEERRLVTKNPRMNLLRLRLIALTEKMRNKAIFNSPSTKLAKEIREIVAYAKENRNSSTMDLDITSDIVDDTDAQFKRLFPECSTVEEIEAKILNSKCQPDCIHDTEDSDCMVLMQENIKTLVQTFLLKTISGSTHSYTQDQIKAMKEAMNEVTDDYETTYLDENLEVANQKLVEFDMEGKTCYRLESTLNPVKIREGFIDYNAVKLMKVKVNGRECERVVYEGFGPVDQEVLIYNLHLLSNAGSKTEFELMLKNLQIKSGNKSLKLSIKQHLQNLYYSAKRTIASALKFVYRRIVKVIPEVAITAIISTITIFLMFYGLVKFLNFLKGGTIEETAAYSEKSGRLKAAGKPYQTTEETTVSHSNDNMNFIYQGMLALNATEEISDGMTYRTSSERGVAVCIEGNVYMTNKHFFRKPKTNHCFYITDLSIHEIDPEAAVKQVTIDLKSVYYIPDTDAALFEIKDFRAMRNLKKHFVCEKDLINANIDFGNSSAKILTIKNLGEGNSGNPKRDNRFSKERTTWFGMEYGKTLVVEDTATLRTVELDTREIQLQRGTSGSPAIHDNTSIERKIIGITAAGRDDMYHYTSIVAVVTLEQIELGLKNFSVISKIKPTIAQETVAYDHGMVRKQVFKYPQFVYESPIPNQSISRSPGFRFTGKFPERVCSYPAIQSPMDERNLKSPRHFLQVSMNKSNGDVVPFFTQEQETLLIKAVKKTFKQGWAWETASLYTIEQAIRGVKKPGSKSINIDGCIGLPYKLEKGINGKRPYIQWSEDQQQLVIKGELIQNIETKMLLLEQGNDKHHFKLEFRKVELVSENKITNAKTRTVGQGNVEDQVVYDMISKDLHTGLKSVWHRGGHSDFISGLDLEVHSNQVIEHLHFSNYLCYDVVAWEAGMTIQMIRMAMQVKLDILTEAYSSRGEKFDKSKWTNILLTLCVNFMDTYVIFEDLMIRRRSGLLSGWPGTLIDNSKAHLFVLYQIFLDFFNKHYTLCLPYLVLGDSAKTICENNGIMYLPNKPTIKLVDEHVRKILAADDVVLAISDYLKQFFKPQDLVEGYNNYGFQITSPDKINEITYNTLTEIEFLKHKFRKEGKRVVAYPMEKVINQLLTYYRTDSKLNYTEQIETNILNAMRFAYFHGEDYYNNLISEINQEYRGEYNFKMTYQEMSRWIERDRESKKHEYSSLVSSYCVEED
jgi:hypothetical protein